MRTHMSLKNAAEYQHLNGYISKIHKKLDILSINLCLPTKVLQHIQIAI